MISTLHFKNFKALRNVTAADLNRLTLLVGPNASGKTSVLKGVYYLSQLARKRPEDLFVGSRSMSLLHSRDIREPTVMQSTQAVWGLRLTAVPASDDQGVASETDSSGSAWSFHVEGRGPSSKGKWQDLHQLVRDSRNRIQERFGNAILFGVVCEAAADNETGCGLADRVIQDEADWITPEDRESFYRWRGLEQGDEFLCWKDVRREVRERGLRFHGHFGGGPGAPDAKIAREALALFHAVDPRPDAIVLLRDDDRQTERRKGLRQARDSMQPRLGIPVVIGLAHTAVHRASSARLRQVR